MKTYMLSFVVLAALVALVSADDDTCNLRFKGGQKCDETYCNNLKSATDECKEQVRKENPELCPDAFKPKPGVGQEEGSEGKGSKPMFPQLTPDQIKKLKPCCEAMKACVEPKVKDEQQYKDIDDYCTKTIVQQPEPKEGDATGTEIPNYHDVCMALNTMGCCDNMKPQWGNYNHSHGLKGKAPEAAQASFMTTDHQIMALFYKP